MANEKNPFPLILNADNEPLSYDEKLNEYRTTLKSCPQKGGWRLHLVDGPCGWVSPRMRELLQTAACLAADDPNLDSSSFIPQSALRDLGGFKHVLDKIYHILRFRHPTTENVLKEIYGRYEEWEYRGPAKNYFNNGGRVEHAIDAVLRMAKVSVEDGVFDEMLEESSEELPVTPFDEDYDLVRVMCLDRRCFDMTSPRDVTRGYSGDNSKWRPYEHRDYGSDY